MLVLALPPKLLEKARPAAEQEFAWQPDGWMGLGTRGKLRRYEGDRDGLVDLEAAGDRYLEAFRNGRPNLLIPANLYRLAGSPKAEPLLRQLQADLLAATAEGGPDAVRTGRLVYVHYLLGEDEQCEQAWATLVAADPAGVHGTGFGPVAQLAAGRAHRDLTACSEAVATFDKGAARARNSFTAPGDPGWYDWLEIALTVQSDVSGQPSDRLREI